MKVWVIGSPGVGKSTLCKLIVSLQSGKHVELDSIVWKEGWVKCDVDSANRKIKKLSEDYESIVFDGGYDQFCETLYDVVDIVILLSTPFPVSFFRVLRRTIKRVLTKERLWNGNIETFSGVTKKNGMLHYALFKRKQINQKNMNIYQNFVGKKYLISNEIDKKFVLSIFHDR